MSRFHTSPDLFNPKGKTNVFNPNSREMLGQISDDCGNILVGNTRDGQSLMFDNTSDALQFFAPMLKRRRRNNVKVHNEWNVRFKKYHENFDRFKDGCTY